MTRIIRRSVQVEADPDGTPTSFRDGETVYRVDSVIDQWLEMGDWWSGEGERHVFRVWTENGGMYDLELHQTTWSIYRIWD